MSYVRVTPPSELPVSVAETKAHLKIDATEDDAFLESLIRAATDHLDGATGVLGRCLVTQTWKLYAAAPTCHGFEIGLGGLQSVDSVKYRASGAEQTVTSTDYRIELGRPRPRVISVAPATWPRAEYSADAWAVTFVAGYGTSVDVPPAIKAGILLIVGDLYENREGSIANTIAENPAVWRLLSPYRTFL